MNHTSERTSPMTGSEKATPRPWKVGAGHLLMRTWIAEDGLRHTRFIGEMLVGNKDDEQQAHEAHANADLIVRAVNTFSEREALLREAADETAIMLERLEEWINEDVTDENYRYWSGHVEPAIARVKANAARIRIALGETNENAS